MIEPELWWIKYFLFCYYIASYKKKFKGWDKTQTRSIFLRPWDQLRRLRISSFRLLLCLVQPVTSPMVYNDVTVVNFARRLIFFFLAKKHLSIGKEATEVRMTKICSLVYYLDWYAWRYAKEISTYNLCYPIAMPSACLAP
jgi:hypothetical protein